MPDLPYRDVTRGCDAGLDGDPPDDTTHPVRCTCGVSYELPAGVIDELDRYAVPFTCARCRRAA